MVLDDDLLYPTVYHIHVHVTRLLQEAAGQMKKERLAYKLVDILLHSFGTSNKTGIYYWNVISAQIFILAFSFVLKHKKP